MKIELETERLYLRNVRPEDYQAVFRWTGDQLFMCDILNICGK